MENDLAARDRVTERFEFYRDGSRIAWVLCFFLVVVDAVSLGGNIYQYKHEVLPQIIAIDDDNNLKRIIPLDEPRMTDADLQDWAAAKIRQVCNISWLNWRDQLSGVQGSFTDSGWANLVKEFAAKKIIDSLVTDRLEMRCLPAQPATIVRKGQSSIDGAWAFDVEVPMRIRFYGQDGAKDRSADSEVSIQVIQVSTARYLRGVAVNAIQFTPFRPRREGE